MADPVSPDPNAGESLSPEAPPRRSFIREIVAITIGAIISIFPLVPGAAVLLDPVLRRKKKSGDGESADPESTDPGGQLVRITSLDSIPAEGAQQFPVIADRHDAWNHFPNERVGAVFLRREGTKVQCFNAVCPHLGCIYSYVASRNEFYCPCHNSAFHLDGSRVESAGRENPAPRPLDELPVDEKRLAETGEVWVTFENFYTGIEEKIPKQ